MALARVGRATGMVELKAEAFNLAQLAAKESLRRRVSDFKDAGLCHGAGSTAHLLGRLYSLYRTPELAKAGAHAIDTVLQMYSPTETHLGFKAWGRPLKWSSLFLEGSVGVGLALMAAVSPIEPKWDRLLLLSSPN